MQGAKKKYAIGIDVGGTKILTGILNRKFEVIASEKVKLDAHKGEKCFIQVLSQSIENVLSEVKGSVKQLSAIGVGCPGMIKNPQGIIKLSPNIAFLENYPLREKLSRLFRVPVFIENDVNAGLYGEQQFGAARGFRHVAGIFMGTGVGGALILNGKLYRGATGAAGEIGHTFLCLPSSLRNLDKSGTVENLTGRLAISTEAALLMMKQKAPALAKETGFDLRKIKSKALLRSVTSGDTAVRKLIEEKARVIGIAMANVVNLLNPERIVLGGGVMEAMGAYILPEAREVMQVYAMGPIVKSVKVVPAKLKDYAIVMGAAKLAYDSLTGEI